jgi:hypothetical protein
VPNNAEEIMPNSAEDLMPFSAQNHKLRSYLKATGLHTGLLLNFNAPTLVIKRIVL